MTLPWSISFLAPWWLLLLLVLPMVWAYGARSLAGLGRSRMWFALALRTVVLTAIILSLAEIQFRHTSEKLTVIYLVDQSQSIPDDQRRLLVRYVNAEVKKHRNAPRGDKAGVIVFAREAAIEQPPYDDAIRVPETIESRIETDATNLAGALKLAQAALPEDSAGRIVIICDGNENIGDARAQARRLAEAGVGIDVVPIRYPPRAEVAVEKVTLPGDVNSGQPFDLQVVLNNMTTPGQKGAAAKVPGKLKITRKSGGRDEVLYEKTVLLEPGKQIFSLREELKSPEFYTYEATFTPDDKKQDGLSQNNQANAFTNVRGQGQVLLIEHVNEADGIPGGQFDYLIQRLKEEKLQVTKRSTAQLFTSLGELQPFDTVILANTPREAFSEDQIALLVRNTQQMGAGLIMLGGEHSFGAGGWGNSELEAALPVDCQIKNAKVAPVGALAMVIDRSGSMSGQNMAMANAAAIAAIDVLGRQDYVYVVAFDSTSYEIVPVTRNTRPDDIKAKIQKIGPGGGTNMEPGMIEAHKALNGIRDAALKHMIVLTDGHTAGTDYQNLVRKITNDKITVSAIAVGDGADVQLLTQIALQGNGKFYHAINPAALPRIFQQEARKISRPLIYERAEGMIPIRKYPHEMLKGIEGNLPPVTGYVRTTVKQSPLVEVALVAPLPEDGGEKYNTLLASWTYGLGKAVAWTSDTGKKWANPWTRDENYDRYFSQMVRWSMRPAGDTGKFTVNTESKEGQVRVVITALNKADEFLNFLKFGGSVLGPDMKPINLAVKQVAPGRYVAEFPAAISGNYFVMLSPGNGLAPILTGVNVPYSTEFLDREPNEALLRDLASLEPAGSEAGQVIDGKTIPELLEFDTFRHNLTKAVSSQDLWHWVLFFGGCLFFVDVFNRRVAVDWSALGKRLAALRDRVFRRVAPPIEAVALDRLRSRKAELQQQLAEQRAAARVDLAPELGNGAADPALLDNPGGGRPMGSPPSRPAAPPAAATPEPEDYTSRLLKAKAAARKGRGT